MEQIAMTLSFLSFVGVMVKFTTRSFNLKLKGIEKRREREKREKEGEGKAHSSLREQSTQVNLLVQL